MVFIRLPTWKTAIEPTAKHTFAQNKNWTPTQKLMLTRNRIWGNIVGDGVRSGYKELKKPLMGPSVAARYDYSHLEEVFPFVKDWEQRNKRKERYQERKLRIFMRGMKIGQQKGKGRQMESMSVFEMAKKQKTPEAKAQQIAEDLAQKTQ